MFDLQRHRDNIAKAKYVSKHIGPSGDMVYVYPYVKKIAKHVADVTADIEKRAAAAAPYTVVDGGLPGGKTWKAHFNAHPDAGGVPTPERAAVHAKIVAKFITPAPPPTVARPTLYLMQGGSGAGKSSIMKRAGVPDSAIRVSNDDVKMEFPEIKEILADPKKVVPRDMAWDAHDEGSYVMKQVREIAIKDRRDIVYDSNLTNTSIALNTIDRFQKLGYNIHLVTVHADENVAAERVAARQLVTGRGVPEWNVRQTAKETPGAMRAIKDYVDNYDLYTTTAEPKLSRTGSGKMTTVRHVATARTDPKTEERTESVLHPRLHKQILGPKT